MVYIRDFFSNKYLIKMTPPWNFKNKVAQLLVYNPYIDYRLPYQIIEVEEGIVVIQLKDKL